MILLQIKDVCSVGWKSNGLVENFIVKEIFSLEFAKASNRISHVTETETLASLVYF